MGTSKVPSDGLGMDHITLPEVLRVIDLVCERPRYFEETFAVVDVLQDSTDEVVRKIAKSFASRTTNAFELGAGNADQTVVFAAWRLHNLLVTNAAKLQRYNNTFVLFAALFTFVGPLVAVLLTVIRADSYVLSSYAHHAFQMSAEDFQRVLKYMSVVTPAFATVLSGLLVAFRNGSKAIALRAAATQIVTEIFKFRLRVGQYDITASPPCTSESKSQEDNGEQTEELNESVRLYRARVAFQKNLRRIAGSMSAGIATEAMMDYPEVPFDQAALAAHVERECFGKRLTKQELERLTKQEDEGVGMNRMSDTEDSTRPLLQRPVLNAVDCFDLEVPGLSGMTSQAYYSTRTKPLLQRYMKQRPNVSCLDTAWTVMLLILTTAATVFAAIELQEWVPILYSLAAFLKTFQEYSCWSARQAAMATAIVDLTNLQSFWASLSTVDKGLPSTRRRLVEVTETAVLTVFAAESGGQAGSLLGKSRVTDTSCGDISKQAQHDEEGQDKPSGKK